METPTHSTYKGKRRRKILKYIIALEIVSFLLQLVGYIAPAWLVRSHGQDTVQYGIWFIKYCVQDICGTTTWQSLREGIEGLHGYRQDTWKELLPEHMDNAGFRGWWEFVIETTLGLLLTLVSILFTSVAKIQGVDGPFIFVKTAAALVLIGGSVVVAAIVRVMFLAARAEKYLKDVDALIGEELGFPWALVISGVGAGMAFLALLMYLWCCCVAFEPNTKDLNHKHDNGIFKTKESLKMSSVNTKKKHTIQTNSGISFQPIILNPSTATNASLPTTSKLNEQSEQTAINPDETVLFVYRF
ncbi:hypothetical protein ACJMK2_033376 [Sinanodonta woodiana]|uniref:Uncharacterized protein n=1 Tax=Sinanodonta woodiana TaxID=1069815 RepID=A0ABD3WRW0_SINWO